MALFSQGAYGEFLEIIAKESINAYVDARLNVGEIGMMKKRMTIPFSISFLLNELKNDWE